MNVYMLILYAGVIPMCLYIWVLWCLFYILSGYLQFIYLSVFMHMLGYSCIYISYISICVCLPMEISVD